MYHIKDKDFIRGDVPMTKEEVRAISIAKLEIKEEDICLDIGAGTGSISIEMANFAKKGKVYSVEIDELAIELIEKNKDKFKIENMELIKGEAPKILKKTPINKIFVGGSKGNLDLIIDYARENLKKDGIIVFNFIVLENLAKAMELLKKSKFQNIEINQIIISRNKNIRNFNMMIGENPIFILSAKKGVE